MAKKLNTKKEKQSDKKVMQKKNKEIKEKISNKGEDSLKNAQTIDLKMDQKTPQIIPEKTDQKTPEKEIIADPTPEVSTDDLVNVLKIPMQEAQAEPEEVESNYKEAIFDDDVVEEEEEENLNDKYFKEEGEEGEDFDSTFFEDEELMSEMAVEVIDLGMQYLAMGIAQDFDNPEKYQVSEYKKKKIKKPLTLLLRKRGTKISPEIMFGVVLLVVYSPMLILAVQERKAKQKNKQNARRKPKKDVANDIPSNVIEVDHEEIIKRSEQEQTPAPSITPIVIPPKPKSKGRPKGSKDKGKRSTKGYKGNKNAK